MAYFAELNSENKVIRVISVPDEHEADGENWCHNLLGGTWKQTSYNARIRGKYAGIGDFYDPIQDIFIGEPMPIPNIPE